MQGGGILDRLRAANGGTLASLTCTPGGSLAMADVRLDTMAGPRYTVKALDQSTWAVFAAVDLNLLVAFDALISERSVTQAARRLSIGQSAMSSTLARLRKLFDDPLLFRDGRTMTPTPWPNRWPGRYETSWTRSNPSWPTAPTSTRPVPDGRSPSSPVTSSQSFCSSRCGRGWRSRRPASGCGFSPLPLMTPSGSGAIRQTSSSRSVSSSTGSASRGTSSSARRSDACISGEEYPGICR